MKKIITSLFIFVFLMLFVNNVNAVTINESTDPTNGLTTIEDNSIIIGVTRFEDGVVITAQRAATAGVNDALFNIGVDGYSGVNIYYYLGGSWFVLDDENQANPLDESNPEDQETIEELESPEIYYVNNVEKQLTVDFTFDGEGSLEFNTDNNKDGLVSFADGKLTIPATVKSLQIKIKDSDTGDVLGLVVLTKDPDNNTDYETTSTTSLTNYINALGRVVKADYTEASWTTYQSVVLANVVTENNTQGEVDTATTNITTAQGSLVFAGLADLNTAKASAAALTETDYTTTSWTTLQTALGLPETTNAEVVTKTTNITTAQGSLVFAGLADLNTAKASAAALTETDYTTTSWTTLQTALGLPETTNAEVVTKTTTLNNAINALVTKLAQAKLDAKAELNIILSEYIEAYYTSAKWIELNNFKTNGDELINDALTLEEITIVKDNTIVSMAGVSTFVVINITKEIGYGTLSSAVTNASDNDMLQLKANNTISSTSYDLLIDKIINLDLNGKTIDTKNTSNIPEPIKIANSGYLTILDNSDEKTGKIISKRPGQIFIHNYGTLVINGGTYTAAPDTHSIFIYGLSNTIINNGVINSYIASLGTDSGPTLSINGGTFNTQLYLAAANSSTIIKGGTFTSLDAEESVIEIKAGTLTIDNGTFTYNFDTSNNNKSVARNNGAGLITGVIVAVKPSGANETNAYASPIIVNLNGGTFTNTMGDAIVSADQSGIGNTFGITLNVEPEAAIIGNIVNYDKPILENVLPEAGNIILENNDQFVLIVDAFDVNLYELEIDHSMEGILPEFSVYADATNPYGTLEDKDSFEAQSVNVTYDATLQKWTINFGSKITNAFIANKGITFYLVLKDTKGNTWGSMYEVNESNTFAYNVSVAYNGPVNGIITDDGPKITGIVNFLGEEDLIISGSFTALTADNYTPFEGELDGSIKGTVVGGVNDNGIDTLSGVITLSSGVSLPIRIIGIFGQTGIDGDFAGEIITGPIPTYVESINITSAGGIDTINVGETLQLGVDILPIEATSNVAWSVYVNDVETGDIDDSGLFTATTPGTATIIAKALDGSLKDDTFDITINH